MRKDFIPKEVTDKIRASCPALNNFKMPDARPYRCSFDGDFLSTTITAESAEQAAIIFQSWTAAEKVMVNDAGEIKEFVF